ncbi:hypothetical protein BYT27DRAFT_6631190 [Phlegmacium glaucopus]|nr:hypothetical protein BYT27DRAFT_6631190 [Phlegmacium glaucopus]
MFITKTLFYLHCAQASTPIYICYFGDRRFGYVNIFSSGTRRTAYMIYATVGHKSVTVPRVDRKRQKTQNLGSLNNPHTVYKSPSQSMKNDCGLDSLMVLEYSSLRLAMCFRPCIRPHTMLSAALPGARIYLCDRRPLSNSNVCVEDTLFLFLKCNKLKGQHWKKKNVLPVFKYN